jgi:hypothetical protein
VIKKPLAAPRKITIDSKIIVDSQRKMQLAQALPDKKFYLVYRGSEQEFTAKQFHALTSNRGPTLTVI